MRIGEPPSGHVVDLSPDGRTAVRHYTIECLPGDDYGDEPGAYALLAATAPAHWQGLRRRELHLEAADWGVWRGSANYATSPGATLPGGTFDQNVVSFSADIGTETTHVTHSLANTAYAPEGQEPIDCHGAIGFDGEDTIAGTDVPVPTFTWNETHTFPSAGILSGALPSAWFSLGGKVNQAPFRIFAAGECLFQGASLAWKGSEDVDVTFHFAAQPNLTDQTIGAITGIAKQGWQHVDVRYEDAVDGQALVKVPRMVYVHTILHAGDFSLLGIG